MTAAGAAKLQDIIRVIPNEDTAVTFSDGTNISSISYKDMYAISKSLIDELKDLTSTRNNGDIKDFHSSNHSNTTSNNINLTVAISNNEKCCTSCKRSIKYDRITGIGPNNNGGNANKRKIIGLSSTVTLELSTIVYSIIQSCSFVLMPLSFQSPAFQPNTFQQNILKTKLKWIVIPKSELKHIEERFSKTFVVRTKTHHFRCLTNYALVELDIFEQALLPRQLVYIVQSSGSTGDPKIIYVTEECIVPNILDLKSIFGMRSSDVILLSSSITFDASLVQMFLSWSANASLLIAPPRLILSPKKFVVEVLRDVTVLQCTTAFLQTLGFDLLSKFIFTPHTALRVLALGGDGFLARNKFVKLRKGAKKSIEYFNIYGTSEVSAWASIHRVSEKDWVRNDIPLDSDWLPIGEELSGTVMEVRDEFGDVVTSGYGELFIGGEKRVCYLDTESLESITTKAKKTQLRSTGDIVYIISNSCNNLNTSGHTVFLCGRTGSKIKRNGHFVSLVALTNIGNSMDPVDSCVCVYDQEKLFVFFQLLGSLSVDYKHVEKEFIQTIFQNLTSSYLPDRIVFVDNIPVTSHGKVDKRKLLTMALKEENDNSFERRRTLKEYVTECWQLALNTSVETTPNSPSIPHTFVACGGDSFAAIFFLNRILQYYTQPQFELRGGFYEHLFKKTLTSTLEEIQTLLEHELFGKAEMTNQHFLNSTKLPQPFTPDNPIAPQPFTPNNLIVPDQRDRHYIRKACNHFSAYQKQNGFSTCTCQDRQRKASDSVVNSKRQFLNQPEKVNIRERWKYNLGKCVDASPLVVYSTDFPSGVVYIGCHSMIFAAISLVDGRKVWDHVVDDRIESTAVISEDGKSVMFGCYDGKLYILDSRTGEFEWTYETKDSIKSSPVVCDNLVIFGSHDKHIYAIDFRARSLGWKYYTGSSTSSSPLVDRLRNCIYVTLLSGIVLSLEISSGQLLWEVKVGKPIFTSPVMCGDFIVLGCVDNFLYAINFAGEMKWTFQASAPIFSSPICVNKVTSHCILFGCNDHYVYCLNNRGICLWKHLTTAKVVASLTALSHDKSKGTEPVAVGEKRKFNDERTSSAPSTTIWNDKSRDKNYVIYASIDGAVGMLNIKDNGSVVASYSCGGEVFSSPVVVGDVIVVGCRDDNVYSLHIIVE